MAEQPIICTACKTAGNVVLEGGQPIRVVCPGCGQFESYTDFQKSVGQQVSTYAADVIGKSLKKLTKGNSNLSYQRGPRSGHRPKFRVIVR